MANGKNEPRSFYVKYRDGRYHRLGRGFLGFGERILIDGGSASGVAEIYDNIHYDDDWRAFPYAGQVVRSFSWTSENPSLFDPGRVELTLTDRTLVMETTNANRTYFTTPATVKTLREEGAMTPVLGKSVIQLVEGAANAPLNVLGATYDNFIVRDEYGNSLLETHQVDGADLTMSASRLFDNDPAAWLVGQLTFEQICSSALGKGQCRTTSLTHNVHGEVTNVERGDLADPATHLSLAFVRDAYGHVVRTRADDALGHHREGCVSYDGDGIFPYAARNGRGHTAYSKQDPGLGVVTATVDPNGLVARFRHDGFGRLTEEQYPDGSGRTILVGRSKDGGPQGNWWNVKVTTRENGGAIRTAELDSLGREVHALTVAAETAACGETICSPALQLEEEKVYDFLGHLERASVPWMSGDTLTGQMWHGYTYDASGRVKMHEDPWGRVTTYAHSGSVELATDWLGTTSTELDALGRVVRSTDKLNNSTETLYGPFSAVWKTVRLGSEVNLTERDAYGRVVHEQDPDRGDTTITYDGFGETSSVTDAMGREHTFTYDALGRIKTQYQDDDGLTVWEYDTAANGVGKLAAVTNDASTKQYAYNQQSQLAGVSLAVEGETLQATFGYDSVGRLRLTAYPQFPGVDPLVVVRDYDAYGNLVSVRDNAGGDPFWRLERSDGAGRITGETYGNGATSIREYDPRKGLVSSIWTASHGLPLQNMTYTYDDGLRMTSRADHVHVFPDVRTEWFTHDAIDRLRCTHVTEQPGMPEGPCSVSIDYQPNGNIAQKSDVGTYTYDPAHPHAVQTAGGSQFGYDAVGNQTSRDDAPAIEYTGFDLPSMMTLLNDDRLSFRYDGDQNRIVKTAVLAASTRTTLYFEGLYEGIRIDGVAPLHRYYVPAGSSTVVITRQAGQPDSDESVAYMHADALGSTELATDGAGNVVQERSYDAFGARREINWAVQSEPPTLGHFTWKPSPMGFTGHEDEVDLPLVNMRGRIYDPRIGRFLQTDPIVSHPHFGQSWNPYSYVLNSPLNFVDPSGFAPLWIYIPEITIVGHRPTMEQQLGGAIDLARSWTTGPGPGNPGDSHPTWMKDSSRDDHVAAGPAGVPQAVREGSPFASMPSMDPVEEAPGPLERTARSWGSFTGGLGCGVTPGCGALAEGAMQVGVVNAGLGRGFGSTRFAWSLGVGLGGAFLGASGVAGEAFGGALTATGLGAVFGVSAMAVSTTAVVGGAMNFGGGLVGIAHAMQKGGDARSGSRYTDDVSQLKLRDRALTPGSKKLRARGLEERLTRTGRHEFVDPVTGKVRAAWDPRKKWPAHWHKFAPDGKTPLNDAGRAVEAEEPGAHIPAK